MADKEGVERKVWLLPTELVERLRSFQVAQGITSEVEAARRLLDSALQMRDTVPDILRKLMARFEQEKDLRVLARDVLWSHPLVKSVNFDDDAVWFEFRDEALGRLDKNGKVYTGVREGYEPSWTNWPPYAPRRAMPATPGWEASKTSGLDDEIPF